METKNQKHDKKQGYDLGTFKPTGHMNDIDKLVNNPIFVPKMKIQMTHSKHRGKIDLISSPSTAQTPRPDFHVQFCLFYL